MFENVSIIIPFQTDHGPRAEAFEWLKKFYMAVMPEAELCLGLYEGIEINKAKAVNQAAKMATRDIFVIADADIVYNPAIILKSIELLKESAWVVPFTEVYDIPMEATKSLLKKQPKWPLKIRKEKCHRLNWIYDEFAGKVNVIPRVHFEAVGGFDERFIGWGGEDDAFAHSVNTLCGNFIKFEAELFHLWHPPSHYDSNPNGEANLNLLNRYISASGNHNEMIKLIMERGENEMDRPEKSSKSTKLKGKSRKSTKSKSKHSKSTEAKGKICFMILVHDQRDLVEELINNVRHFCPNSSIVLYNGGDDPTLCDYLGVPVCPSSRRLERGFTTIYFLETMEWLEEMGMDYEFLINIDSDALFIKEGYEQFIQTQMEDADYMAVKLRIPEEDWYIGNELKKDIHRWKELFNVDPFHGIFNVGQVFNKSLVKAFLQPERKDKLKQALLETISFGTDEIFYVNLAKEFGFRIKSYPNDTGDRMIRYRPHFTLDEMIQSLNEIKNSWLCHPVYRDNNDLVRRFIKQLCIKEHSHRYRSSEYPWYESNQSSYMPSLPLASSFGNNELIVQSGGSLSHYWEHKGDKKWYKSETFAEGVTGMPIWHETARGQFEVVSRLAKGGIGLWRRDNHKNGHPWHGPFRITNEDIEPIMLANQEDGRPLLVCRLGDKLVKLVW